MRARQRFSRTLSRARWPEYRRLLTAADEAGYHVVSLEDWVIRGAPAPTLVLRHDVDQHPASSLPMASIEEQLGHRSTWYFRWRTAHPVVIAELRSRGFQVGLHYETLTRALLRPPRGTSAPDPSLIAACRDELRVEIEAFAGCHGPIRSVCPHGDSRVPGVNNGVLLRDEDCSAYGIEFDGNEAMRGRKVGHWLTDRSSAEGGWGADANPLELIERRVTPILCLTHPNNWASGPGLWLDRMFHLALPAERPRRPIRTGRDTPPLARMEHVPTEDAGRAS